jgi:hypothetical protein
MKCSQKLTVPGGMVAVQPPPPATAPPLYEMGTGEGIRPKKGFDKKWLLIGGAVTVVFLIACGIIAAIAVKSFAEPGYKGVIVKYLRDNLGDPHSLEIVEWGKPIESEQGKRLTVNVSFRAKNPLGAKMLKTMQFAVEEDKVVSAKDVQSIDTPRPISEEEFDKAFKEAEEKLHGK